MVKIIGNLETSGNIQSSGLSQKFTNTLSYTLTAGVTTSNINLSALTNVHTIKISNTGSTTAFFSFTNTATTDDIPIYSGDSLTFTNVNFDYVSAITSSGTSDLSIIVYESEVAGEQTNAEVLTLSVTTVSSNDTFADTTATKNLLICNIGVTDCYYNFGATATVSNAKILAGTNQVFMSTDESTISAITSASTTTLKVLGVW